MEKIVYFPLSSKKPTFFTIGIRPENLPILTPYNIYLIYYIVLKRVGVLDG